ncbi:hypothetical protein B9Z55_023455 [Caenorhabditis nigoni]|uniref:Uncharacterized protein n=1 Tax=Caenorhabditis nigoni TaxID=1611254 RepID=A0A2G5SQ88_9PELO|nr:hypothetical protein B9Z55_023455 [Caenorhabditis nigoni]
MGTNGGVIAAQSVEIETNENPEKVAEPVVRRKRVTRRIIATTPLPLKNVHAFATYSTATSSTLLRVPSAMYTNLLGHFHHIHHPTPKYYHHTPFETPVHTPISTNPNTPLAFIPFGPATPIYPDSPDSYVEIEKTDEEVKKESRKRHRRIHSKNNCLTPPNSDDDVSLLLFFLNQVRQLQLPL